MSKVVISESQAAQAVAEAVGIKVDPNGNVPVGSGEPPRGRDRDIQFEQRMEVIKHRTKYIPAVPATVFNFLPIKIVVNSPLATLRGGVPAAKGKDPFATRTWDKMDIIPYNPGEGGRVPYQQDPFQLAMAFEKEYPYGGVIWLQGSAEEAQASPENKERLTKAAADAVRWMRTQVGAADGLWNAPDRMQRRNVTLTHRLCAQRLYDLGILKALPEWHKANVELEDVPTITCVCGKKPESKNTVRCSCGYILDPAGAYQRRLIDEESVELERLTRAQVKELGISDYVAETVDERAERIKGGVPKPPSKMMERVFAAEAAQQK